ncbi:MAG: hypothetical protein LBT44_02750 [Clostridiales bacterium]|jgi:hypothetical protein|nr:hypothetical protein [Clostridiales bacterium]
MNELQKYFLYRQSLIDQYVKGDMSKREYLARNLEAVLALKPEPFRRMDTLEKGLFNYQYYNALAKAAKDNNRASNSEDYYYAKKDKATLAVLRLIDYRGVTAYFIRVRSPRLKGRLFEMIIPEYQMILHSANAMILESLRGEGVFVEETRQSLIDGYINQKY